MELSHRRLRMEPIKVAVVHPAFQKLSDAYAAKLAGNCCARCQTHPHGEATAWSMQGVVEHLILTYRGTVIQTEKYRQRGTPSERKSTLKQAVKRTVVVGLGYFPAGNPAPDFVRPGLAGLEPMTGEELAHFYREELSRLDEQLDRCEQAFGRQRFATHFLLGPMSVQQWRKFHLVHGRHHLGQLDRIAAQLGSPA